MANNKNKKNNNKKKIKVTAEINSQIVKPEKEIAVKALQEEKSSEMETNISLIDTEPTQEIDEYVEECVEDKIDEISPAVEEFVFTKKQLKNIKKAKKKKKKNAIDKYCAAENCKNCPYYDEDEKECKKPKNKKPIIFIAILLILAIIGGLIYIIINGFGGDDPAPKSGTVYDANDTTPSTDVEKKSIVYPGYNPNLNKFKASENRTLGLVNPKANGVNFVYTISENDKVVYTSDPIEPDGRYEWEICKYFGTGKHVVNMKITPYSIEDGSIKNGINQTYTFVIE